MYLISCYNDNIVLYKDGKLTILNPTTKEARAADLSNVVFVSGKYLVDSNKYLFVIENYIPRKVLKFKRNVFWLREYNNNIYVADSFGDFYRIQNEECEYVLGTLAYLVGVVIHNDNVLLGDKYGRIRISKLDGRILDYKYLSDPIVFMTCIGEYPIIVTKKKILLCNKEYVEIDTFLFPYEQGMERIIEKDENEFVVILRDSYHLFRVNGRIELISTIKEPIIDGVFCSGEFYKLNLNNILTDSKGKVVFP